MQVRSRPWATIVLYRKWLPNAVEYEDKVRFLNTSLHDRASSATHVQEPRSRTRGRVHSFVDLTISFDWYQIRARSGVYFSACWAMAALLAWASDWGSPCLPFCIKHLESVRCPGVVVMDGIYEPPTWQSADPSGHGAPPEDGGLP